MNDRHISKLAKKTRRNDVVFPTTFSQKPQDLDEMLKSPPKKKRQLSIRRTKSSQSASSSLLKPQTAPAPSNSAMNRNRFMSSGKQSASSLAKRRAQSNGSLTGMYYAGMERQLEREVKEISKMKQPQQAYLASASIRPLSQNYLLVQRKFEKLERPQSKPVRRSRKTADKISIKRMQSIQRGLQEEQSSQEEETPHQLGEFSTLNVMEDTIHQLTSLARIDRKQTQPSPAQATLKVEVEPTPKQKINREAVKHLTENSFMFFAAHFSIYTASCFRIQRLTPLNHSPWSFHFHLVFSFYQQVVFRKVEIEQVRERRPNQHSRRDHLRFMQMTREGSKERALCQLLRPGCEDIAQAFLVDLIIALQNELTLTRRITGLCFVDRSHSDGSSSTDFHFLLKLNYTFYLIRAQLSGPQMTFTFLCDFTSLNSGSELQFKLDLSTPALSSNKLRLKRMYLQGVVDFVELAERELGQSHDHPSDEPPPRIINYTGLPSGVSIERWKGHDWNTNFEYSLEQGLNNFFTHHNNFDYGYLDRPQHFTNLHPFIYTPNSLSSLMLYQYPSQYCHLNLTKPQQQAFLIPHIPQQLNERHSAIAVKYFIKRHMQYKQNRILDEFVFMARGRRVTVRSREQEIQITLVRPSSLRLDKISIPLTLFSIRETTLSHIQRSVTNLLPKYTRQSKQTYSYFSDQPSHLNVLYKGVEKFEGRFVLVCMYELPLHYTIECKFILSHLGRQFVMKIDNYDCTGTMKQTVKGLVEFAKDTYFKDLLYEEAYKKKIKKEEAMNEFFKQFGTNNISAPLRNKKRRGDELRERKRRLATLKVFDNCVEYTCESIISEHFRQGQAEYYLTIRYSPQPQLKEGKNWRNQTVDICLHKAHRLTHFKITVALKDVVSSLTEGIIDPEFLDAKRLYSILSEVRLQMKRTVKRGKGNMAFIGNHIQHFLSPPSHHAPINHPIGLSLLGNELHRQQVPPQTFVSTKLSIDFEIERDLSRRNLALSSFGTQKQYLTSDMTLRYRRPKTYSCLKEVTCEHVIEAIDVGYINEDREPLLKDTTLPEREIWITERFTGQKYILEKREADFMTGIGLGVHNRKMLRRLLKAIKRAI